jgi:hypothetical protein
MITKVTITSKLGFVCFAILATEYNDPLYAELDPETLLVHIGVERPGVTERQSDNACAYVTRGEPRREQIAAFSAEHFHIVIDSRDEYGLEPEHDDTEVIG